MLTVPPLVSRLAAFQTQTPPEKKQVTYIDSAEGNY